jgi:hypothetical protein
MLLNPVQSNEKKLKFENWRRIPLTNAINRVSFMIIAEQFQDIHKKRRMKIRKVLYQIKKIQNEFKVVQIIFSKFN